MPSFGMQTATSSRCFSRGRKRAGTSLRGVAVHELGEAQHGREAERRRWQRVHMPIIKTELLELIYGGGSEPLCDAPDLTVH